VNLIDANLCEAKLHKADLYDADLSDADLRGANLNWAILRFTNLRGANLHGALLNDTDLSEASFSNAYLFKADLRGANLSRANLHGAELSNTNLSGANLRGAHLMRATLVETDLTDADLTGCRIFGVSAWSLKLERAKQQNLVITHQYEPEITIDNIEVAQFIYLLLHNQKVRDVIDTVTSKVVLILGRFTDERKAVLDALREELRKRNYLPILFDFSVPATRDITETISLLARMARFVVVRDALAHGPKPASVVEEAAAKAHVDEQALGQARADLASSPPAAMPAACRP
jgi:hypothetical protein